MEQEQVQIESENDKDVEYINAIKELKANSVPKEKFDKVVEEKRELLQALVNGDSIEVEKEESKTMQELREAYFREDQTNLEMAQNTLALRKAIMDEGGQDPFLPFGATAQVTQADIDGAEKTAQYLQHCIDVADGDPGVFNTEFQRGLKEAFPQKAFSPRKY